MLQNKPHHSRNKKERQVRVVVIRIEISSKEIADLATILQGQPVTKEKIVDAFVSTCVEAIKKQTKGLII